MISEIGVGEYGLEGLGNEVREAARSGNLASSTRLTGKAVPSIR